MDAGMGEASKVLLSGRVQLLEVDTHVSIRVRPGRAESLLPAHSLCLPDSWCSYHPLSELLLQKQPPPDSHAAPGLGSYSSLTTQQTA